MKLQSVLRVSRCVLVAFALCALGRAMAEDARTFDVEATRAALTTIEMALKDENLTDADLQRLRAKNDPLGVSVQAAIADLSPQVAASAKRLAELTPKSKEAAPETSAAAAEFANEKQKYDALDGKLRAARAMLLEVDDNATRISAARRELFARETFARSSSIFDPSLWLTASRDVPVDIRVMTARAGGWLASLGERITPLRALGLASLAALLPLIAIALRWIASRYVYQDDARASPSRLRRAIAAAWNILVLAALPLIWLRAFAYALDAFGVFEPGIQGVLDGAFSAVRLLIIFNALSRAMLSPRARAWRVIAVSDRSARLIYDAGMAIVAIWAAQRLVEPTADAIASLSIAVAARGLGAVLIALIAARLLQSLAPTADAGAAASPEADAWAPARTLGWIAALTIFLASAGGYIAFASFVVNQTFFLTFLACGLYLADVVFRGGTEALLDPDAPLGRRLLFKVGLRRNVLAQIVVIIQGMARVVLVVVAAAAVLEPWGVQSQDLYRTLRAAYFGFTVGGVTVSLSSLIAAAAVFGVVLFATRLIQEWLRSRLLPHTRLDPGVGNSISTIFGYLGLVVAVLLGGAQIGLDAQKLALVAGGLSVGIGFGLQTIANNFVSGLILLWERGIRVGDWIVVGAEQGYVRRINARSTEIETFDRATLIVPNSTLVTGVVKNWVLSDRIGRVMIPINVAYESDVEEVRDILIGAAKAQDLVLAIPAPSVQFAEFGEWALKFNLVCFVDDIEMAERTKSEMNFDILRRLRDADIRIPYPQFGQLRPGAK